MKNTFPCLCMLLFFVLPVISCNSSDGTDPSGEISFKEENYKVTSIQVSDIANNGNAGDLSIVFTEPAKTDIVTGYRILVFPKSETMPDFSNDGNNYQPIDVVGQPLEQQSVSLDEDLKLFDGTEISEGILYQAAIISLLSNDSITYVVSDFSNDFELVKEATVSTLVKPISANDALTIDPDGNIYASNFNGSQIVKISQSGNVSTYTTGLSSPLAILYQNSESIIAIDKNNGSSGRVSKVNSAGEVDEITQIEGWPSGLTKDGEGNVLVANYLKPNIYKISDTGVVSVLATDPKLKGCVGIYYDVTSDIIYTSNYDNGNILKVDKDGLVTQIADIDFPSGTNTNLGVTGYLTMLDGILYVSGLGGNQVYSVTIDGVVTKVAGTSRGHVDGTASLSKFDAPNGIVGYENKLFVLDYGQPSLRVIDLN